MINYLYLFRLSPPNWVFPIIWPALYLMIGYALQLVFGGVKTCAQLKPLHPQLAAITLNLALNYTWSLVFFRQHKIWLSLLICKGIFISGLVASHLFGKVNVQAGQLLWPYCAWTGFATYLNWRFWVNNRGPQITVTASKKRK